jgi:hypothetical protein
MEDNKEKVEVTKSVAPPSGKVEVQLLEFRQVGHGYLIYQPANPSAGARLVETKKVKFAARKQSIDRSTWDNSPVPDEYKYLASEAFKQLGIKE